MSSGIRFTEVKGKKTSKPKAAPLKRMRSTSKTGGAVGQVSARELAILKKSK